jgi:hypothetical protein
MLARTAIPKIEEHAQHQMSSVRKTTCGTAGPQIRLPMIGRLRVLSKLLAGLATWLHRKYRPGTASPGNGTRGL